ncbi:MULTISPECIES: twin-arginine translocase subunit TatC [Gammaproteobacteria]|uniref:twin-arginine translocase subunit TatC n=1 Tax=Gammaproteobacteria TaxID=1236 RepID=UPI000DD0AB02|nr:MULTISPECIES: twin-arginine translocase subunit TatC [Gammaproteobacteria]RTE85762.1 twin-arginine translocase subunit TatC [Aliidiomarina sp. B3213]TCZ90235.1 twin-arginine translocase subunit TatC [Lysobacter sp. N42]
MSGSGSLLDHLVELRKTLLRSVLVIVVIFLALAYFARDIYELLAAPLMAVLPPGSNMIATDVAAPFFAPFKLTFVVAFALAVPFLLHQIWRFIAPGLYQHEKRLVAPLLVSSSLLFYAGIAFAFFVVLPLAFGFFTKMAPEGITIATDISSYLNFVLKIFFAFGFAFEIPIAIILLCWTGTVTAAQLRQKRPYVIVGVFVIGMLLTPPDVISQTLLALPMWLLFEVGVIVGGMYGKSASKEHNESGEEEKAQQDQP